MQRPDPENQVTAPDYLGALRIFRAYDVNSDSKLVSPYVRGYIWEPGVNTASCAYQGADPVGIPAELALTDPQDQINPDELIKYREHLPLAPDPDCRCGFYGHLDVVALKSITFSDFGKMLVYGACDAWGRIELHRGGLRAQHVKLTHLALSPFLARRLEDDRESWGLSQKVDKILEIYQVPLIDFQELWELKKTAPKL